MRKVVHSLIILLLSQTLAAQYPFIEKVDVGVPGREPLFNKVLQDSRGYLWLGSQQGLYRYDGNNFKAVLQSNDSTPLHITALYEASDRTIWTGCKDGRIYFIKNGIAEKFDPEEGTSSQSVSDILIDQNGIAWWSTNGEGLYFYAGGRVYNLNREDGLSDNYVYDLESDRNGVVWAASDAGLTACSYKNGQKTAVPLDKHIRLSDIIVRIIKEDYAGNLWLGFQDGGSGYLTPDRSRFIAVNNNGNWNYGPVTDISLSGHSAWIATASGILLETEAGSLAAPALLVKHPAYEFGKILDLLEDQEGNVWILAQNGLYRSSGTRVKFFDNVDGKALRNIHAVGYDIFNKNQVWFSNDEGLFLLNTENGNLKPYLEDHKQRDLKFMCLYQDPYGYIWAGTFNYGVFRINPINGSWARFTEKEGLVNNNVLSISGHHDTLWMATLGGASEVILDRSSPEKEPLHIISHNRETGLVSNFIYAVYEDRFNRIWFATDGDGLIVRTAGGWMVYDERNGLGDDVVYSITGDQYDNIWVGTATQGIYKFSDENFVHYGTEQGLSSLEITAISAYGDELLIVHNYGLDIMHIPTERIAHLGLESGMGNITPDLNVINRNGEGHAWIGTRTGLISYQSANMASYGSKTVLEEMLVYLEPIPMKTGLSLKHNDNHISFTYAGLWLSNPAKVSYQVYLEGYDLGWKTTYDKMVTYSSLPKGDYVFRVRSSNDHAFRNASEARFSFRIKGPFWLSAWFLFIMLLVLAATVFLFIRYREDRLRRQERAMKEKIEFEFQVLKNQVNPHFLFNSFSTLMSLIEEEPEQALKYTEYLSDFFRTLLQYKDRELISFKDEITLVENYFFLLKKRYGENLMLEIEISKEIQNGFIPPMTLQILIENAVKHNIISKEKPLKIKVFEEEKTIVVENNLQMKLNKEKSTGIGLENVRKRYRLITEKEIMIKKTEQVFRVELPVI